MPARLVPIALVAVTLSVYVVPAVRPETLQVAVSVVLFSTTAAHVADGLKLTVYPVMGDPPLDAGYAQETTMDVSVT